MVLVGKPQRKSSRRRTRRWWDKIKTDLQEMSCEGVEWIDLAQDRTSGEICEQGNEPSGCTKCGGFLELLRNYQILGKDPPAWS